MVSSEACYVRWPFCLRICTRGGWVAVVDQFWHTDNVCWCTDTCFVDHVVQPSLLCACFKHVVFIGMPDDDVPSGLGCCSGCLSRHQPKTTAWCCSKTTALCYLLTVCMTCYHPEGGGCVCAVNVGHFNSAATLALVLCMFGGVHAGSRWLCAL